MKEDKKRNLKKAGLAAGILCLASVGGISAYLTDFDKADNQFTVGKVSIDLEEPGFDQEEQTKIEPGKEVKKILRSKTQESMMHSCIWKWPFQWQMWRPQRKMAQDWI